MHHPTKTLALVMAACAAAALALPAHAQSRGASASVTVSVVDGAVRVSASPVAVPSGVSTITWQMATTGWRFAAGSIDFGSAAGSFNCRVFNEGAAISCNRSSTAPKGELPYVIRLSKDGAMVVPPQPTVYISLE